MQNVNGYKVKYVVAAQSKLLAPLYRRFIDDTYPGTWGQPASRTAGGVDFAHGATARLTLDGAGVCNTIIADPLSMHAGTLRASVFLPKGCYRIAWLFSLVVWTDSPTGSVSLKGLATENNRDLLTPIFERRLFTSDTFNATYTTNVEVIGPAKEVPIAFFEPTLAHQTGDDRSPIIGRSFVSATIVIFKIWPL